jgi:hypothetical protein
MLAFFMVLQINMPENSFEYQRIIIKPAFPNYQSHQHFVKWEFDQDNGLSE